MAAYIGWRPRSLHPEHGDGCTGERVALVDLGRSIAAAGIGNPLIGT
jgi:hypothetical protein